MDAKTKHDFDEIMRNATRIARDATDQRSAMTSAADHRKREFDLARTNVIHPILREFQEQLSRDGFVASIEESEGGVFAWGERPLTISLVLSLPHLSDRRYQPEIEFRGYRSPSQHEVYVVFTIVTANDARDEVSAKCDIDSIDADFVRSETLKFLRTAEGQLGAAAFMRRLNVEK